MDVKIFAVETDDLFNLIHDEKYKKTFFFYCDVEEFCYSCDDEGGFKRVRKFNNYWFRQCIGIPVCSRTHGCYMNGLNMYVKQLIDNSFKTAVESIQLHKFDTVFYPVSKQTNGFNIDIRVYEEHPFVHTSVVSYIMKKIKELSTQNIMLMMKRSRSNTI